jgi:hypothetical protein
MTTTAIPDSPPYSPSNNNNDQPLQRSPNRHPSPSYSPPPPASPSPAHSPTVPYEYFVEPSFYTGGRGGGDGKDDLCFVCQLRPHSPQKLDCETCRFIDDTIASTVVPRFPSSAATAAALTAVAGNCLRPIPKRSHPLPSSSASSSSANNI